jgi:hypothetical protein
VGSKALWQEAHVESWKLVHKYVDENFKCFRSKNSANLEEALPQDLEQFLDGFWSRASDGIRRLNNEHIIYWVRLETMGVLTVIQKDWLTTFLTARLWADKTTSAAVVISMNRSEQLKAESPAKLEKVEKQEDAHGSESDEGETMSTRDTNREFQKEFEKKSRALDVRDLRISFTEESVYGKRRGCVDGFLILADDKNNVYRKSPLYRRGTVDGVVMQPRATCRKPPLRCDTGSGTFDADGMQKSKLGVGSTFTPVQMLKQHTAGISFFQTVISKLHSPTHLKLSESAGVVTVDLFGYDGFSAEGCFALQSSGSTLRPCVTVNHSYEMHKYVTGQVSRAIHTAAKDGTLEIRGFPKFQGLVDALDAVPTQMSLNFNVTTLLPCGSLVVNESLMEKWLASPWTQEACQRVPCP